MENPPYGKKKRGTIYRLADEYSIFYHGFIKGQKRYTPGLWVQIAASQTFKIWSGFAFDPLCLKHVGAIKRALETGAVYVEIYSVRIPPTEANLGFQIDLLIDRKDDSINLSSLKSTSHSLQIVQKTVLIINPSRKIYT